MVDVRVREHDLAPAPSLRRFGLHRINWLRRLGLLALQAVSKVDISIAHHWAPQFRFQLNAFRHKTYWYHGRRREHMVMRTFAELIEPGATVIDLGGHIGYISLYLARLVGPTGKLFVFEPQPANLRYLERNAAPIPQIEVVPKAASDQTGGADFFAEGLTGENSTLVPNQFHLFATNRKKAFSEEHYHRIEVETVALDDFIAARGIRPDFIKIDIEGAELLALRGMSRYLAEYRPKLMIEVTCNIEAVTQLLEGLDYRAYCPRLTPWAEARYAGRNRFYLPQPREAHAAPTAMPSKAPGIATAG